YRYEPPQTKNISGEAIDSTATLVRYVIGVNTHLTKKEEEGWLYVEKIKEGKQEDQIVYGKRIDLPILEDNPYLHDLLDPFDTKKVIPFV
ncbi:PcfA protein, partial [Enterococcus faecalis]